MSDDECPMCKLRKELLTTQIRLTMAYAREGNKNFDKQLEDRVLEVRDEIIEKDKKIQELEKMVSELEKRLKSPAPATEDRNPR